MASAARNSPQHLRMTRGARLRRPGEFALIAEFFAPLARGFPGAFGLTDDVAVLASRPGHELVLKTDSLIEGVHFLRDDPAGTIGRKALRRALSDLAAKGAEPHVYLLALALPEWSDAPWLRAFADGLAADQAAFGISLAGGETGATPGPLTITITALGYVREGTLIRRAGATADDMVFVTGTIGDAAAGLLLAKSEIQASGAAREFLIGRYRIPTPRLAFGRALRGLASAAIDVSDGLLADLGHLAESSSTRIEVDAARIPLSDLLMELGRAGQYVRAAAAAAGDDYEIAFSAAPKDAAAVMAAARATATQVTAIGRVLAGRGIALLDEAGREIGVEKRGYTHF